MLVNRQGLINPLVVVSIHRQSLLTALCSANKQTRETVLVVY